jgi:hypothetical protein
LILASKSEILNDAVRGLLQSLQRNYVTVNTSRPLPLEFLLINLMR